MNSHTTTREKILALARELGVLRVHDLKEHGLHPEYLRRLHHQGLLIRTARGLYCAADAAITENHSLAETAKRLPHGVICLLTALQFHRLGTQLPHETWIAIDRRAASSRIAYPPLRVMRFSGKALTAGIETHLIEGVMVKVYGPAKTVADCFKYRNKIGLDVALEALRDCRQQRKCTMDELWEYAKICRVANVMRPYLEALS